MWTMRNSKTVIYLLGTLIIPLGLAQAEAVAAISSIGAPSHHQKTASATKVLTVTKKDHDSTIHMNKGGILAVRLEWSPGTGYSWTLENPDKKRFKLHGKPVHETAKKPMPGAPEVIVFNYEAIAEGSSTLKFVLKRPFEKKAEPVDRFTLTVEVSAK